MVLQLQFLWITFLNLKFIFELKNICREQIETLLMSQNLNTLTKKFKQIIHINLREIMLYDEKKKHNSLYSHFP